MNAKDAGRDSEADEGFVEVKAITRVPDLVPSELTKDSGLRLPMPSPGYRGALLGFEIAASEQRGPICGRWLLRPAPLGRGAGCEEVSSAVEQSTAPGERDSFTGSRFFCAFCDINFRQIMQRELLEFW
jgi:hypothetical protein